MKAHHKIKNGVSIPGVKVFNKTMFDNGDMEKITRRIAAIEKETGYTLEERFTSHKTHIHYIHFEYDYSAVAAIYDTEELGIRYQKFAFNNDDTIDSEKTADLNRKPVPEKHVVRQCVALLRKLYNLKEREWGENEHEVEREIISLEQKIEKEFTLAEIEAALEIIYK